MQKGKDWSFVKMKDVYEHTTPKALSAYIDGYLSETKAALEGFDVGAKVEHNSAAKFIEFELVLEPSKVLRRCHLAVFSLCWFAVLLNVMILLQQYLSDNTPTWFFYLQLGTISIVAPMLLFIQAVVVKYLIVGRFEEADPAVEFKLFQMVAFAPPRNKPFVSPRSWDCRSFDENTRR